MERNDIQIVGGFTSGMAKDIALLESELRAAALRFRRTEMSRLNPLQRMLRKAGLHRLKRASFGANVFIQQPEDWWMPEAAKNFVIPNQEWFTPYGVALLPRVDEVWCKTHTAERIFSALGCRCRYLGFTSEDRRIAGHEHDRNYREFLHIGSNSIWKGTQVLVDTWCRHPEWPRLTVVARTAMLHGRAAPSNLTLLTDYMPDEQLLEMQNRIGLYIHPTEMEGFGHSICEAMSTHAVVLTTDAAPMNELVTAERGVPIAIERSGEPHNLGERFFVSQAGIETAVKQVLALSDAELRNIGNRARAWYEENDRAFKARLRELLEEHFSGRRSDVGRVVSIDRDRIGDQPSVTRRISGKYQR